MLSQRPRCLSLAGSSERWLAAAMMAIWPTILPSTYQASCAASLTSRGAWSRNAGSM